MPSPILPPIGTDLRQWGRQLSGYLQRNLAKLGYKTSQDNPSENGVILWDNEKGYPVVSKDGAFDPIVTHSIQHAHGTFERTTDATVTATTTAYTITFDTTAQSAGVLRLARLLVA